MSNYRNTVVKSYVVYEFIRWIAVVRRWPKFIFRFPFLVKMEYGVHIPF